MFPFTFDDSQIALKWLERLRWFAVVGQVAATAFASFVLKLDLQLLPIGIVIALTALSNIALMSIDHASNASRRAVPGVVLLDMLLLTAVLVLTGGATNPFAIFYVIHVAMAVVLLPTVWSWIVVGAGALLFGVISFYSFPLTRNELPLPEHEQAYGRWVAIVLVSGLIVYFIGKVQQALIRREAELATARDRAAKSERLAAVTALAAGAAHELGSPLGTIAVVTKELELASGKLDPDVVEDIRLIRQEVDRCRGILDRMRLDVGDDLRQRAGEISAAQFAEGAIADLIDERRPRVKWTFADDCSTFYLPSRAIVRAVGVLLRNGFEASPSGSTVTLNLFRENNEMVAEVRDEGSGMSPEILERAGEPFFTTKELGRGMGMGLFIVKLIAEQSNGRLVLASELGRGTTAQLRWVVDESSIAR